MALGVELIAEGVETATQLEQLRELKVGVGQGYHFARPLEARGRKHGLRLGRAGNYYSGTPKRSVRGRKNLLVSTENATRLT